MHISKVCFIIYYILPTCFGRSRNYHRSVIQEYKRYTYCCTKCVIKTSQCYS